MCGRFRLARKKEILEEAFGAETLADDVEWWPTYAAHYNVAPTQEIVVVRQDESKPVRWLTHMRWGLIPAWSNDPGIGAKMINARSETAAERPAFREPLRLRRCLVPADGFYEWKREGKHKLPYAFSMADDSVFAFAGIWDRWKSPQGQWIKSCSILTTAPNELMKDVHDRMPVIVPADAYDLWLDPGFKKVEELQPILKPYDAEAMRRYRVSARVNQVKNDDAECAAEVAEPTQAPTLFQ